MLQALSLGIDFPFPPLLRRPSWFTFAITALAGLFFVGFAAIYLSQLVASGGG
jgi:hypothetical protein